MKKRYYLIETKEIITHTFIIEANDKDDAFEKVEDSMSRGDYDDLPADYTMQQENLGEMVKTPEGHFRYKVDGSSPSMHDEDIPVV